MLRGRGGTVLAASAALAIAVAAMPEIAGGPAAQRGLARGAVLLLAAATSAYAWWSTPPERRAATAGAAAALFVLGIALVGAVRGPMPGARLVDAWGPVTSWPALQVAAGSVGLHLSLGSAALILALALALAVPLVAYARTEARAPRIRAMHAAAAPPALLLACLPCIGALAWMPSGGSSEQTAIARFFWQATAVALLAVGGVISWLLVVTIRRRAGPAFTPATGREGAPRAGWPILAAFVILPAIVVYAVGALSLDAYNDVEQPAVGEGRVVEVIARQWEWEFRVEGEPPVVGELVVRAGERVHLVLTSEDVIHSFFVPELGVKQDALPGGTTHASFHALRPGVYAAYCAEYCGTKHTLMEARVRVLPEAST